MRSCTVLASRASPGSHRRLYTDHNSRPSFPHDGVTKLAVQASSVKVPEVS